jgi:fructose-1,6-bisphosphatase
MISGIARSVTGQSPQQFKIERYRQLPYDGSLLLHTIYCPRATFEKITTQEEERLKNWYKLTLQEFVKLQQKSGRR